MKLKTDKMKLHFDATDVGAWLIIVICGVLMGLGVDGDVKSIMAISAGWAFRKPINNVAKKAGQGARDKIEVE